MAKMLKYIGTSHWRRITADEWASVGVRNQETVEWNQYNNWTVPATSISDEAMPFIEADPEIIAQGK